MRHDELVKHIREDWEQLASPDAADCIERLTETETRNLAQDGKVMEALLDRVAQLQKDLNSLFVGRQELIEMGLACFIAHVPMVALGPPGTAKSNVFRAMSYGLGLQDRPTTPQELAHEMDQLAKSIGPDGTGQGTTRGYFEYLVTRFTTPEEMLGPAHLSLMINHAVFYRKTMGVLPEAEVAFLDEIFKANSAILNALLSIMNERLFYNAGRPTRIPLCMVFGASNEPPEEKELGALYDRFPVRVPCLPVDDTFDNMQELMKKSLAQACNGLFAGGSQKQSRPVQISQVVTVNHFRLLHRILHVRYGGRLTDDKDSGNKRFLEAYYKTFRALRREFEISDRSYSRLYLLSRGLALLRGHGTLDARELDVFKYCFRDLEAAPPLREAVEELKRRYPQP